LVGQCSHDAPVSRYPLAGRSFGCAAPAVLAGAVDSPNGGSTRGDHIGDLTCHEVWGMLRGALSGDSKISTATANTR